MPVLQIFCLEGIKKDDDTFYSVTSQSSRQQQQQQQQAGKKVLRMSKKENFLSDLQFGSSFTFPFPTT